MMANSSDNSLEHEGKLTIAKSGVLSLVQDRGRHGYQHLGIGMAGVVDPWCASWANRLVGNPFALPLLELTLGGLHFQVNAPSLIALTGSAIPFTINGRECRVWQSYPLSAGDRVSIGLPQQEQGDDSAMPGIRHYLSIRGGFLMPAVLNSVATNMREGMGGLNGKGRALERGDALIYRPSRAVTRLTLPQHKRQWWQSDLELCGEHFLRVIPCAQYKAFPKSLRKKLFSESLTIASQSNRMGYRFEEPLFSHSLPGMLSEATGLGALQLPNGGKPIVLLNDRQTLGGYPKLGSVAEIDCWRLAQMPPGQKIHFQLTSVVRAQRAKSELLNRLKKLRPEVC